MTDTLTNQTAGARARRGAGNEPKRKRAREDGCKPTQTPPWHVLWVGTKSS